MSKFVNELTTARNGVRDLAQAQRRSIGRQTALELLEVRLTQGLQRSLKIEHLLEFFCREIAEIVPCDSVAYQNNAERIAHVHGTVETHICQYQLTLEGQELGHLICTRAVPFGDLDLLTIESLAGTLVYPLRNALLYQKAISLAMQDPLTGVGNRKALENSLHREVKLVERYHKPMSMLMIDVDHFKRINDTYGHSAGDQALKHITGLFSAVIRQSDQVFRYGGEEFIILLNDTDKANAQELAERIRTAVAQTAVSTGKSNFALTISIGVAEYQDNRGVDAFLKEADTALYEAKDSGRNQVIVAA